MLYSSEMLLVSRVWKVNNEQIKIKLHMLVKTVVFFIYVELQYIKHKS